MGWGGCEISFCVCRRGVDRVYLGGVLKYLSCLLLTISIGYIFDYVLSYIGNLIKSKVYYLQFLAYFGLSLYYMRLELCTTIL